MKKPEKQVLSFSGFEKMLQDLYQDAYYELDFINPVLWYAIYIAAEADADNTVNGVMAYYDTVEMMMMFNTTFLDAMVMLRGKLTMLDEFAIKDSYRLN
tara:strand:+ start:2206 stop:2502 length:297 start_codon:yes stop_codon:yes gene_type:complete